jgi:hypothetical protein
VLYHQIPSGTESETSRNNSEVKCKVKTVKTQLSASKIMAGVFWDSEGVIHVDFLPRGVTINAQYYINLLHNGAHQTIQKKSPGKLSKKINPTA